MDGLSGGSSLQGKDRMWADFKMNCERVNQQADKQ